MTNQFYYKNKKVRGHKRHTKSGRLINVNSYERKQRYRNYAEISRTRAEAIFNQRSRKARSMDLKSTAKTTLEKPNEKWEKHVNKIDVQGIDTKQEKYSPFERIDITIPKWNEETYALLKDAEGDKKSRILTSEEIIEGRIDNLAKITGPDEQYGLSRSWLGDTTWDRRGRRNTTYNAKELDDLSEGTIIELRERKEVALYKKIGDGWKKIAIREAGSWNTEWQVKGVISTIKTGNRSQQELQLIVENADNLSDRVNALRKITNESFLEHIATSDASWRLKSEAYKQIKSLNPNSEKLSKLRNYYQKAREEGKRIRQEQEAISHQYDLSLRRHVHGRGPSLKERLKLIDRLNEVSLKEYLTPDNDMRYIMTQTEFNHVLSKIHNKKILSDFIFSPRHDPDDLNRQERRYLNLAYIKLKHLDPEYAKERTSSYGNSYIGNRKRLGTYLKKLDKISK